MNNCNCNQPKCGCNKPICGCGKPVLGVEDVPNDAGTLKYNVNGVNTYYDYTALVKRLETDTSINVDAIRRVLNFMAERHIDAISAKDLGSILHLADIGDVNIDDVKNNSMLVYNNDTDCGQGCQSTSAGWIGWNADEHYDDSVDAFMGFNASGTPKTLQGPTHLNQYYQLAWKAGNKAGWTQPRVVSQPPVDANNKAYKLYVDPTTHEIVAVAEEIN